MDKVFAKSKNVKIQIQCSYSDDICNEYGADTLRLYEMFLDH
jgi:leucyl-tRNA synthetase